MCVRVPRTRAVSLEFSLYNVNTDLLAVFSFLFEFPVSERALSSLDLSVITLWPITGLDLQLLLVVSLRSLPCPSLLLCSCSNPLTSCFSAPPVGSGALLPGEGHHWIPQRGLRLPAVRLEDPRNLQTGAGGVRLRAPPEPLCCGLAAVGGAPETSP